MFSSTAKGLQTLMSKLNDVTKKYGKKINSEEKKPESKDVHGDEIEQLKQFRYLGSVITLHLQRIPERIQFKLAVLVHRVLSTRQRPVLPWTVHSVVRRSKSIITVFCIISSSHHLYSSRQSVARLSKGVSGVWAGSFEQFAG